ncbi:MAG TPA: hypothetical protein VKC62_06410 [Gaiellaceae bacterium]|nr:hypothetical protein [Gaiellaceae bacterium]
MSPWLAAAYAALALGLAWSLAGSAAWRRRAAYIVCAPPLALALWLGRADPAGWPSGAKVPAQSSLVWGTVDEPDPVTGDRGHIYLWLDVGSSAPRAYALPYSRSLHEQVQQALNAIRHGQPITVSPNHARGTRRNGGGGGGHGPVRFYAHPPIRLPPKTTG